MIRLEALRDMAKTDFEKELISSLEQQFQARQHDELSDAPSTNNVGKGEFKMQGDSIYYKLADGTLYKITATAV